MYRKIYLFWLFRGFCIRCILQIFIHLIYSSNHIKVQQFCGDNNKSRFLKLTLKTKAGEA